MYRCYSAPANYRVVHLVMLCVNNWQIRIRKNPNNNLNVDERYISAQLLSQGTHLAPSKKCILSPHQVLDIWMPNAMHFRGIGIFQEVPILSSLIKFSCDDVLHAVRHISENWHLPGSGFGETYLSEFKSRSSHTNFLKAWKNNKILI